MNFVFELKSDPNRLEVIQVLHFSWHNLQILENLSYNIYIYKYIYIYINIYIYKYIYIYIYTKAYGIKYKGLSNSEPHKQIYLSSFEKEGKNCQYKKIQASFQRTLSCNIKLHYENYCNKEKQFTTIMLSRLI